MAFGNTFRRLAQVTAAMAIGAMSLSACEPRTPPQAPQVISGDDTLETVAATVDGYPIYVSTVQMEAEAQGVVAAGETLSPDSTQFTRILNSLIDDRLLAQEAESLGLDDDPYVQHRLRVIRDRLLGNMLLAQGVDEAAIQKYYETSINLKQLKLGEEFRIRQIVVPTREAADALLKDLKSDTDFAVLASNKSIDGATRLEGGDLGFVNPEQAREELARAIMNTPIGGVSRPFETENGWHIIKVEEKRPEPLPTLAELRPQIWDFLIASELERLLKNLHGEATIVRSYEEVEGPDLDPFTIAPEEAEDGLSSDADIKQDREL